MLNRLLLLFTLYQLVFAFAHISDYTDKALDSVDYSSIDELADETFPEAGSSRAGWKG